MHWLRSIPTALGVAALLWLSTGQAAAAEPWIPAKPSRHFNDLARVVPAAAGQRIDAKLAQFERETSNQVLVAIFPRLPEGTYLEEFTVKAAEAWGAGTKERDNGIILFVFIADREMRIEVGYGLEGVVPDSIAARIIHNELKPRFRANDYAGGVDQAVEAIFKATRGEYKGSGRTLAEGDGEEGGGQLALVLLLVPILFGFSILRAIRKGMINGPHHRRHYAPAAPWWLGGGGGGGFSGGGGFGGGFSGGGGSFGGGGASGSW